MREMANQLLEHRISGPQQPMPRQQSLTAAHHALSPFERMELYEASIVNDAARAKQAAVNESKRAKRGK